MHAQPELIRLLAHSTRRRFGIAALYGAAVGLAFGVVFMIVAARYNWPPAAMLASAPLLALTGAGIAIRRTTARLSTAAAIEQRAPDCRNLIVTAAELSSVAGFPSAAERSSATGPLSSPARPETAEPSGAAERVHTDVAELVQHNAAQLARTLDAAKLFPIRNAVIACAAVASVWLSVIALATSRPEVLPALVRASGLPATIRAVEIVVTPPAYTNARADTLRNPERIEVLAGSRIDVRGRSSANRISIETIAHSDTLSVTDDRFTTTIAADADGYIALAPLSDDGSPGTRRLIGLSVHADQAPRVRITAPARDLFAATVPPTLDIAIEANDDFGLGSLALHYTRVTGSGEQFTFVEGTTPLAINRADARTWKATGTLLLDTLKLTPGDMLVYRAVATDRRPGAPAVESDSYIVEVTGPGALAAGGFTIDDDRDRYAVSQQMLIVFTERLIARRDSLTAEQLREESLRLAAVQRQVRAEFVFMMGGELAEDVGEDAGIMELNEHAEAEAEDDILAGRLANRGRVELMRAIRWMSSSAALLTDVDLATALTHEKNALDYLQRAFSRSRYILRTLTERERLDLSRRLTGTLTDASSSRLPVREAEPDSRTIALRGILADLAAISATLDRNAAQRVSAQAEALLRVDPANESIRTIATQLNSAAEKLAQNDATSAQRTIEAAALQLAQLLRSELHTTPGTPLPLDTRLLDGALTDALRHAGVR